MNPHPQRGAPVLEVEQLGKSFGGVRAVDQVSFTLGAGELLALIGPNGAGKTTCFNMLNGQLRAGSGSVRLGGRQILGLPPRRIWRLGVGRTFQITATFASMTVRENVQMALLSHHHRHAGMWRPAAEHYIDEAEALLARVGMHGQSDRACGVLAYGDIKRVELAVALANDPILLLMDEPTAGMAPKERIELMALTADIVRERDISVLFTEHDMDVVFAHADRIMVLDRGRLIVEGTPGEVRANKEVQDIYLGTGAVHGVTVG
jgi:branched-chain amino acid transport system ATP-binding protein